MCINVIFAVIYFYMVRQEMLVPYKARKVNSVKLKSSKKRLFYNS